MHPSQPGLSACTVRTSREEDWALPLLQLWICSSGLGAAVGEYEVLCKLHEGRVVYTWPEDTLEAAVAGTGHGCWDGER